MKCEKCNSDLMRSEEEGGLCSMHKTSPALTWKRKYELFGGADFDESEDGPYRPRKHREGQWSRLQEDEGMTGID